MLVGTEIHSLFERQFCFQEVFFVINTICHFRKPCHCYKGCKQGQKEHIFSGKVALSFCRKREEKMISWINSGGVSRFTHHNVDVTFSRGKNQAANQVQWQLKDPDGEGNSSHRSWWSNRLWGVKQGRKKDWLQEEEKRQHIPPKPFLRNWQIYKPLTWKHQEQKRNIQREQHKAEITPFSSFNLGMC